jgi:hypothetical protein
MECRLEERIEDHVRLRRKSAFLMISGWAGARTDSRSGMGCHEDTAGARCARRQQRRRKVYGQKNGRRIGRPEIQFREELEETVASSHFRARLAN